VAQTTTDRLLNGVEAHAAPGARLTDFKSSAAYQPSAAAHLTHAQVQSPEVGASSSPGTGGYRRPGYPPRTLGDRSCRASTRTANYKPPPRSRLPDAAAVRCRRGARAPDRSIPATIGTSHPHDAFGIGKTDPAAKRRGAASATSKAAGTPAPSSAATAPNGRSALLNEVTATHIDAGRATPSLRTIRIGGWRTRKPGPINRKAPRSRRWPTLRSSACPHRVAIPGAELINRATPAAVRTRPDRAWICCPAPPSAQDWSPP
jgi:hypothetical protein